MAKAAIKFTTADQALARKAGFTKKKPKKPGVKNLTEVKIDAYVANRFNPWAKEGKEFVTAGKAMQTAKEKFAKKKALLSSL